jgi:hypothetical protein
MTTKSELLAQIDKLTQLTDTLRADNEQKARRIAAQDHALATLRQNHDELVPLKSAAREAGVKHKTAWVWAERGWIKSARKDGGRWFANIDDLKLMATTRAPTAKDQRG